MLLLKFQIQGTNFKYFFAFNCITKFTLNCCYHGTYYGTIISLYYSVTLDIRLCKNVSAKQASVYLFFTEQDIMR